MTLTKPFLDINKTVILSVLLHAGFFMVGLFLAGPQSLPVPLGMELRYSEPPTSASAPAASHRPRSFNSPSTRVDTAPTPQTPAVAPVATSEGTSQGTSATGALQGREGSVTGTEVSAEERYVYELQRLLERRKNYPVMARKMGQTGTVTMRFTVKPDGSISESEVIEKSVYASLNQAALDLVKSIHGLKPFPPEIQRTSWTMTIPINYDLK